ncbi:MAG: hypothetical protein ACE5NC_07375 [Anaerolineae bacterium]
MDTSRAARIALSAIVVLYLLLGTLYAIATPSWQAPDEPAHYNYVRHLAETGTLPVLTEGDWDQAFIEATVSARFPPEASIAPFRYEFHQPPLYYLMAVPLYQGTQGLGLEQQLIVLRLLSVVLGAGLLVFIYRIVALIFPDRLWAAASAAFVATLPQHVAMMASVNNDALAELVLALLLWVSVATLRIGLTTRRAAALGVGLGIAILTKTTIYLPALAAVVVPFLYFLRAPGPRGALLARPAVATTAIALVLSGPWVLRNAIVYGPLDPFGLARHEAVVIGQPTTAEWVAEFGPLGVAGRFVTTTFRSFWGQFGWMAVPMPEPIYVALGILTLFLAGGAVLFFLRILPAGHSLDASQRWSLGLLAGVLILVVGGHIGYNLQFVQHQGRYLFPALVPLSTVAALGAAEWARRASDWIRRRSRSAGMATDPVQAIGLAAYVLLMAGLSLIALFRFVVPNL